MECLCNGGWLGIVVGNYLVRRFLKRKKGKCMGVY